MARRLVASALLPAGLCLLAANLGFVLLYLLLVNRKSIRLDWAAQLAFATELTVTGLALGAHLWLRWFRPAQKARRVLAQIRAGEGTIEELMQIGGGITPLLREVQEILIELRRQKSEVARIEAETAQRIANRTDALERMLGTIRQQASRDALTGLHNRRMLDDLMPQVLEQCRQANSHLSLLMVDVDDFKLLNDSRGHAAGDEFLRSLAQLIRSTLREIDHAFRYGGDEFLILLPHLTATQAELVGERLISLVDGLSKSLHLPRPPRLSIGVSSTAEFHADVDGHALVKQADQLLYDIKVTRKAKRKTA